MKRVFILSVIVAMLAGLVTGLIAHAILDADESARFAAVLNQVTGIFLRLIKMIIGPLVLTTLISGIGHIDDISTVGRIGAKALIWFVSISFLALIIGIAAVNVLQPGLGATVAVTAKTVAGAGVGQAPDLASFLQHLIPTSIFDALSRNETLQVVLFSMLAGTAVSAVGEKSRQLLSIIEQGAAVMFKITNYVMMLAPVAIFAAIAGTLSTQGGSILITYGKLVTDFYLALLILIACMVAIASIPLGRDILAVLKAIRSPALVAFSTSTSEAAYPLLLEALETIGFNRRIVSFVLPLGYSFNMVGGTMYCAFASMFIAQAYGITISIDQQILMLLLLMLTSKGIAGVPRAALVVVAGTLPYFNLPESGLLLIGAVDHLMDMGRSAVNVIGNGLASAVVDRWELTRPTPSPITVKPGFSSSPP